MAELENANARIVQLEQANEKQNTNLQRGEQMYAALETKLVEKQRIIDDKNLREAARTEQNARRALQGAPDYDGNTSWRRFKLQYETFFELQNLQLMEEKFKKDAIVGCMKGRAIEMIQGNGIGQGVYNESLDWKIYLNKLGEIFVPPEESVLTRV